MNKRETNMKTIAGVKVADKTAKRFNVINLAIIIAVASSTGHCAS